MFWEFSDESSRNDRGLNSSISSVQNLRKIRTVFYRIEKGNKNFQEVKGWYKERGN